jgi:ribonuclease E
LTRRMLINAREPQELRIAVVDGSTLDSYQVEVAESGLTRGNIYRGVVAGVQPNLNAAFIEYGVERHGFLSVQDVVPEAYHKQPPKGQGRPRIDQVLEKGRPLTVQVTREAVGNKGAVLTTELSLAGRYLVLTPYDDTRGVSRKVEEEETRKRLKDLAAGLNLPSGCGAIVRTNALDQTKRDLNRDLNALLRVWKRVGKEAGQGKKPKLIYSDQDLILRTLRDTLDSSVREILVDDEDALQQARQYLKAFLPRTKIRLQHYDDRTPLFSRYGLEAQIERIYDRRVELPGGGSIVIDPTEALVAIDVNSGRTKGGSGEETALNTNLEAAREVARQLRLRDIGGLVVVDFIDMRATKNRRRLEKELKEALKEDRARAYVGRISPNGLLEVNRQRIQQELRLRSQQPCPTCHGTGRIASIDILGLSIMRRLRAAAANGDGRRHVRVLLHPATAAEFQNSRRAELLALETEFDLEVEVVPTHRLHRPESELEWGETQRTGKTTQTASPLIDATQLAVADSARSTSPKRSRGGRGKRGGRGRRPADAKDQNGVDGTPDAVPQAAPAEQSGDDGEAEAKKKPRRRRGGRGRKSKTAAASASAGPPAGEAVDKGSEAASESADDKADKKPRRRRGGRGRKSKTAAASASDGQPAGEATDRGSEAPTEGADDKADKKPRRRRRRRRRKRAASGGSA